MIETNARVLIVGMARSGIAAAKLLLRHGAVPLLNDKKPADAFDHDLDAFLHTPCEFRLGEDPVSLLPECDLVVISPGVPLDSPVVTKAESHVVPLIGELELAFSLLKGRVIAVTGTNGKTTTVSLLGELFANAGQTVHVGGNIGFPLSAIAMESRPGDVVVTEVSSFQLETIRTFRPETAALLNITEDHLNRHTTMDAYTALKKRVFENQTEDDLAVLNYDDTVVRGLSGQLRPKVVWFSRQNAVDNGVCLRDGTVISVINGKQTPVCGADEIRIPGPHNLENAMAAAVIGIAYGVSPEIIRETLRTFAGVEHRIETVRTVRGVTFINDSKGTNVASTLMAVQSMTKPTVIILGGYDKHTDFNVLAAAIAKSDFIHHAVLIGETAEQIAHSLSVNGFHTFTHARDLGNAVYKAADKAAPGGNVLFSPACASFDMFRDYEHRGAVFKEIVDRMTEQT
ncbi:MAG: UDP-N-acetylmuramoyl-L-alanine--D-glutamate ligase [Clostridiales bacterium]|nr:UDP-N-acetylmuramoyl-L-alanine--D-glutamate ligase [Clostridiales bacterium]